VENEELIFGRNPVLEYLRGAGPGDGYELYLAQTAHGKIISDITKAAEAKKITVQYKDKAFFAGLGPSARHQGVALRIPAQMHEPGATTGLLIEQTRARKGAIVLLDRITDPHNVGSIIRTAEALGCRGIILSKSHAPGITPAVVKASAGATAHVEIHHVSNIASFLDQAKAAGLWIVGASDRGEKELGAIGDVRPCVIVIGSEDAGMRHLTLEKCDFVVRIPLSGKVSSLNASVAAGIILYQVMRN
jgi:23S rRNA (guanosine2251-2'-O)-methyltransferase